ncbi:MAG: phosphoglucosamine mutase [Actinobacteria bacterium]|nr:phosphoglucosamine mutase [Actinomycetota bacterium]MCB9412035.1 phosphoglucosamine mutase [Actinomycetota bacterium]
MGGRLFGTDGVRGVANVDLTAEIALDLAVAAAHVLGDVGAFASETRPRPLAIVGRDTRASGEFLEAAVVAGLASAGVDVYVVGVLPTPGVAFLTADLDADLGVMLSASHNPMPDNGIKFFARGGVKLADELEDQIEARMGEAWERPTGADVGRVLDRRDLGQRYLDHLLSATPSRLTGIRCVVDAAFGAASEIGPTAYRRMGAEVVAIHAEPDGYNINEDAGSTHMDALQQAVVENSADIGIAHDGDADRCLVVDAHGRVVDGDQMMAILAVYLKEHGELAHDTLVTTVMSNLGLKLAMTARGIDLVETAVGDRYVLEAMREGGFSLGGEQSGHVVLARHATTGDGVLTALTLMAVMASSGSPLDELASVVTVLPQVLINVGGVDKSALEANAVVAAAVADVETDLAGRGRVLLRKSGTEPLVRVMVEADSDEQARQHAERLAEVVRRELSLT